MMLKSAFIAWYKGQELGVRRDNSSLVLSTYIHLSSTYNTKRGKNNFFKAPKEKFRKKIWLPISRGRGGDKALVAGPLKKITFFCGFP